MAKKSAWEEAKDFLGGIKSKASSAVSSFGRDYMNYAQQQRQKQLNTAQRVSSFIKDNPYVNFTQSSALGPLGQIKPVREVFKKIPEINFAEKATQNIQNPYTRALSRFGLSIPETLANTPRMLTGDVVRAEDITRSNAPFTKKISAWTKPAEGILNVATLGVASPIKQVGKEGLKQLLKTGAKTGFKYGLAYGGLEGLRQNENASSVGQQIIGAIPTTLTGGVLGLGIGAGTMVLGRAISKYITPQIRKFFLSQKETGGRLTPGQLRDFAFSIQKSRPQVAEWLNFAADSAEKMGKDITFGIQGEVPTKTGQLIRVKRGETYSVNFVEPSKGLPVSGSAPQGEAQLFVPETLPLQSAGEKVSIESMLTPTKTFPQEEVLANKMSTSIPEATNILDNISGQLSPKVQEVVQNLTPVPPEIKVPDGIKVLFGKKYTVPEDIAVRLSKEITALENEIAKYSVAGMDVPKELSSEVAGLYGQLSGENPIDGINQKTVVDFKKEFDVPSEGPLVETSPFEDIVSNEIPNVKGVPTSFDQTEEFQATIRMLDEFRRVNSEIPDILAPVSKEKTPLLSNEELALKALENFRGTEFGPEKVTSIQYPPETEDRFQELAEMKVDFQKQIGEIEDAVRNYSFYEKRFGELLTKPELKRLKTDLLKSVKQIDTEVKELQKTGKPVLVLAPQEELPLDDALSMEALKNWRDGVPPVEKSPAEAITTNKKEDLPTESRTGKPSKTGEILSSENPMNKSSQGEIKNTLEETNSNKGISPEFTKAQMDIFNSIFARWIGQRDVAKTEGVELATKFADIPTELGPEIIRARENPDLPMSEEVAKWIRPIAEEYNRLFQEAVDAGINIHYLNNYMTHIWDKSPEEVATAYLAAKTRFNFAGERIIPTYDEGIQMGLKPRFTHPAQIIAHYVERLEQTKANVKMMLDLKAAGIIVPASEGMKDPGFAPVTAPGVNRSVGHTSVGEEQGLVIGDYYAPRKIASLLNKVFSPDERNWFGNLLSVTGKASGLVQDVTLSGGLPFTPINAYTAGQFIKEITAGVGGIWNSPLSSTKRILSPVTSVLNSIIPGNTERYFKRNINSIKEMQARNIPLSTTHTIDNLVNKGLIKRMFGKNFRELWNKAINEPTFKKFMPMIQINMYNEVKGAAIKKKYSPEQAADIAAKAVKNFYGVVGSETIAKRSRVFHDAISTVFFAPKYRESMVRIWWTAAKASFPLGIEDKKVKFNNPFSLENKSSTNFLIGTLLTIIAYNFANMAFNNGKMLSENPKGMNDKLLIPLEDGNIMGIPVLPSVGTVPRAMIRTLGDLTRGDIPAALSESKAYLSSLLAPLVEAASNENYFGQQIYEDNDTPAQKYKKIGMYLAKAYNHPWIEAIMDKYQKKEANYITLSKGLELPIRWYTTKSVASRYYYDNLKDARNSLAPESQQVWDKLYPSSGKAMFTDEDGLPVDDTRSQMANALDRLAHPEIVDAETQAQLKTAEEQNVPVNPFYLLNPEQQMTVLMLKTFYPGEETKKQIQNQNLEWLKPYWEARDNWYNYMETNGLLNKVPEDETTQMKRNTVGFLMDSGVTTASEITSIINDSAIRQGFENAGVTEDEVNKYIVERGYIKPSETVQKKLDYYNTLPQGTGARSRYIRANPDVKAFFDAQSQLTNDKRTELGLPPITSGGGWGSYKAKPKIKIPKSKTPKISLKGPIKTVVKPLKLVSLTKGMPTLPGRTSASYKSAINRTYKPRAISLKVKSNPIKI